MNPSLAPSKPNSGSHSLSVDVDRYLERVGLEQRRFLSALSDANRELGRAPGHLAKVAAIQTRLTREFLDAQRAILKRRAETDADIADIAAHAEEESALMIGAARSGPESRSADRSRHPWSARGPPLHGSSPAARVPLRSGLAR